MSTPMRRREFITLLGGAAATCPFAARAQPKLPVVGWLSARARLVTGESEGVAQGLSNAGFVEGRNVAFEFRETEQYDRLPMLASELVARRVAAIVTVGTTNAALAAKAATATIPIVFSSAADPIKLGLVADLERVTGLALVPLTLWFVVAVIELAGADRDAFVAWVRHPVPAVLLVLLLIATFYHNALGLQVVIEDYVENEALRFGLLIIMKLVSVVLAVLGIFAVLKLSFAA